MDELNEPLDKGLPQLDGACDVHDKLQMDRRDAQDNNAIRISSDSDEPTESLTSGNAEGHENTDEPTTKSTPASEATDLTTPPRKKGGKFGQELDTNAKAPLVQSRRSPRKHRTEIPMPQSILPAPTNETKKRKKADVREQTFKQKRACKTFTKYSTPRIGMDMLRKEIVPQKPVPSRPRPGLSSPDRPLRSIRPAPPVRGSSPLKLTVHFAKRLADEELPDSIAEEEWEVFQSTHPTLRSKICFCNQAACHGKFKKGEDPQIAQCVKQDCLFRWFHYVCLDLSEKGKARWGKVLCSVCHVEQKLVERDRNNGWKVEKMINLQPMWTKEDIEEQLPGLRGVIPRANPYGLDLEVQLWPCFERQIREKGTLGGLVRPGYPQSHPEMLEEAYLHAGAYRELLAKRAEEDQDVEWEEEAHREGEENYDEGVYDEEIDEAL
ncbi:hypothetical protein E8E12_003278 [Didymella heteroderae]|uniref:Zinc finger PHD-type domain-containing protein n=1 Tax=Didymella heteroderae TaxID=1769908 RepID=A0A9P4WTD2_9PLEO|nr:hypothetical protein E8E12_003278 [Didymella heteroderae]